MSKELPGSTTLWFFLRQMKQKTQRHKQRSWYSSANITAETYTAGKAASAVSMQQSHVQVGNVIQIVPHVQASLTHQILFFPAQCTSCCTKSKQQNMQRVHQARYILMFESDHSVCVRFRAKDLNIERLHYVVSTNLALIQSNMAWLSEVHGPSYHWIPDMYTRVGLPVGDDIVDACKRAVCDAWKTVYTR